MINRERVLGELVTFKNSKGFHLDGIFYLDDKNRITIIHIHGSFGNFFQNQFLRLMAKMYHDAGINLLSFNLACHDGVAEGYCNENEFEYVGGGVTDFSTCIFDIEGAIAFASQFSDRIVLQGHSLGCDRILHFLLSRAANYDFVLLSPCDSYQLQTNWIAPESVEQQIARLKAQVPGDDELDWLPTREYGIRQGENWTYPIPITRKALLSITNGPPFKLIRIGKPAQFSLNQNAFIYIGGNDALQTSSSETMFRYFEDRIRKAKKICIPYGDHNLAGCEHEVIEQITSWVWS